MLDSLCDSSLTLLLSPPLSHRFIAGGPSDTKVVPYTLRHAARACDSLLSSLPENLRHQLESWWDSTGSGTGSGLTPREAFAQCEAVLEAFRERSGREYDNEEWERIRAASLAWAQAELAVKRPYSGSVVRSLPFNLESSGRCDSRAMASSSGNGGKKHIPSPYPRSKSTGGSVRSGRANGVVQKFVPALVPETLERQLCEELVASQEDLGEACCELEELQERNGSWRVECEASRREAAFIEKELDIARAEAATIHGELDVACVACDALHQELRASLQENADMESARSLTCRELEEARLEVVALREDRRAESAANREVTALREELESLCAAPGTMVVALRDEISRANREVASLREELRATNPQSRSQSRDGRWVPSAGKGAKTRAPAAASVSPFSDPTAFSQSLAPKKPIRLQPPKLGDVSPTRERPTPGVIPFGLGATASYVPSKSELFETGLNSTQRMPLAAQGGIKGPAVVEVQVVQDNAQGQGSVPLGQSRSAAALTAPSRSSSVPGVPNRRLVTSQSASSRQQPVASIQAVSSQHPVAPSSPTRMWVPQGTGTSTAQLIPVGEDALRATGEHLRHASRLSQLVLGPHEPLGPHLFQSPGLPPEYPNTSYV